MSKHTRSKQGRTHGAYRKRLEARGLQGSPLMPFFRQDAQGRWVKTSQKPVKS